MIGVFAAATARLMPEFVERFDPETLASKFVRVEKKYGVRFTKSDSTFNIVGHWESVRNAHRSLLKLVPKKNEEIASTIPDLEKSDDVNTNSAQQCEGGENVLDNQPRRSVGKKKGHPKKGRFVRMKTVHQSVPEPLVFVQYQNQTFSDADSPDIDSVLEDFEKSHQDKKISKEDLKKIFEKNKDQMGKPLENRIPKGAIIPEPKVTVALVIGESCKDNPSEVLTISNNTVAPVVPNFTFSAFDSCESHSFNNFAGVPIGGPQSIHTGLINTYSVNTRMSITDDRSDVYSLQNHSSLFSDISISSLDSQEMMLPNENSSSKSERQLVTQMQIKDQMAATRSDSDAFSNILDTFDPQSVLNPPQSINQAESMINQSQLMLSSTQSITYSPQFVTNLSQSGNDQAMIHQLQSVVYSPQSMLNPVQTDIHLSQSEINTNSSAMTSSQCVLNLALSDNDLSQSLIGQPHTMVYSSQSVLTPQVKSTPSQSVINTPHPLLLSAPPVEDRSGSEFNETQTEMSVSSSCDPPNLNNFPTVISSRGNELYSRTEMHLLKSGSMYTMSGKVGSVEQSVDAAAAGLSHSDSQVAESAAMKVVEKSYIEKSDESTACGSVERENMNTLPPARAILKPTDVNFPLSSSSYINNADLPTSVIAMRVSSDGSMTETQCINTDFVCSEHNNYVSNNEFEHVGEDAGQSLSQGESIKTSSYSQQDACPTNHVTEHNAPDVTEITSGHYIQNDTCPTQDMTVQSAADITEVASGLALIPSESDIDSNGQLRIDNPTNEASLVKGAGDEIVHSSETMRKADDNVAFKKTKLPLTKKDIKNRQIVKKSPKKKENASKALTVNSTEIKDESGVLTTDNFRVKTSDKASGGPGKQKKFQRKEKKNMEKSDLEKSPQIEPTPSNDKNNESQSQLRKSKSEPQDKQKFHCTECDYKSNTKNRLAVHMGRVHGLLINGDIPETLEFKCQECAKDFLFKKDLNRHIKVVHHGQKFTCSVCDKTYKSKYVYDRHLVTHEEGYIQPMFRCQICEREFTTKFSLGLHIKSDHLGVKKTYSCPMCGKSFSQIRSYRQHANVHAGIRPYKCEVCGKSFTYDKSLKEHRHMHDSEPQFQCKVCSKMFRQQTCLLIHMKTHKDKKDHICSVCGREFTQKQSLLRHERIHTGDKPYTCKICFKSFGDYAVIRKHVMMSHKKDKDRWKDEILKAKSEIASHYIEGGPGYAKQDTFLDNMADEIKMETSVLEDRANDFIRMQELMHGTNSQVAKNVETVNPVFAGSNRECEGFETAPTLSSAIQFGNYQNMYIDSQQSLSSVTSTTAISAVHTKLTKSSASKEQSLPLDYSQVLNLDIGSYLDNSAYSLNGGNTFTNSRAMELTNLQKAVSLYYNNKLADNVRQQHTENYPREVISEHVNQTLPVSSIPVNMTLKDSFSGDLGSASKLTSSFMMVREVPGSRMVKNIMPDSSKAAEVAVPMTTTGVSSQTLGTDSIWEHSSFVTDYYNPVDFLESQPDQNG